MLNDALLKLLIVLIALRHPVTTVKELFGSLKRKRRRKP
jgi:hypothetical protein